VLVHRQRSDCRFLDFGRCLAEFWQKRARLRYEELDTAGFEQRNGRVKGVLFVIILNFFDK